MHVSYGLHNENICISFELVYLKVDTSLSIYIYLLMSLRQRYTCSFMFKFTETETAVSASCLLYFTKAQSFVVIVSAHK